MLFEIVLVEVYEVIVNVILKLNSNSCSININLSDDTMILIKFEVPSQHYLFNLQVSNMVSVVLHSHKWLVIYPLGYSLLIA